MTKKELLDKLNKNYFEIEDNLNEIEQLIKGTKKLKDELGEIIQSIEDDGIKE